MDHVVERKESTLGVDFMLAVDWQLDKEDIARLQVLSERINRNDLASADNHGPVLRNLFQLAIPELGRTPCPYHKDQTRGDDKTQLHRSLLFLGGRYKPQPTPQRLSGIAIWTDGHGFSLLIAFVGGTSKTYSRERWPVADQ